MIRVTRLNGEEFYINPDLIQYIEKTPDTVITLTNDRKVVVREEIEEIIERIIAFKQRIYGFTQGNERLAGE
ncbi:MAG: flagellar FlbD family protein [Caldicoprobacter oshimai]|uniref:Flagellar protein FlbD n=1 Tax=Caldicoprobacter faecalis TaxID=937334 RepID=A0A1I5RM48_9FIRM|nr:flagellar FlbD family protein [Caldicoprobacter faecalis]PZN09067.1 MAG: endoflagellar protein [Caldicoprobacter oshimai]SFP59563.1 flagellar protein FlbD [Caldicoprobacter faecalis]